MPPAAGRAAAAWLAAAGVTVLLRARVADWGGAASAGWGAPGDWALRTADGATLRAGAVFNCIGGTCKAPYLAASVPAALRPNGTLDVCARMRVRALRNAFAAGDCAGHGGEANALAADISADVAAANILAAAARKPLAAAFPGGGTRPEIACVSFGPYNGVLQFNGLVVAGPAAAALKWLIECLQLGTAAGQRAHAAAWGAIEATNVFLGQRLFRGGLRSAALD
jgi:NADH dehydrogenase FAD-containing subunit